MKPRSACAVLLHHCGPIIEPMNVSYLDCGTASLVITPRLAAL